MKSKIIFITLIISVISLRCEDDIEPLFSQGMVTGTVFMQDKSSASNTNIIAHGPYGSSSTVSNADGTYTLTGLGNGTYNIEFHKEGYGRKFLHGVQVFGKDTLPAQNIWLFKMADYKMPELKVLFYNATFSHMDEHSIAFSTDIPADNTEEAQIRAFISDVEDVSHKNYIHSSQMYRSHYNPSFLVVNASRNPRFEKGQTLYLIAYVCSNNEENGEYSDYYGLPIFSTVDEEQHSRIFKFIAPS